jgi:hypothetical protein
MTIRYYSSIAQDTVLPTAITSTATLMTVASTTGWPSTTPFTLAVDFNSGLEELVDVTNVAGLTATIVRGVDGTTPTAHGIGATVRHVITARDMRDANTHINATNGVHGVPDQVAGVGDVTSIAFLTMGA